MDSSAWRALLRLVAATQPDNMLLVTTSKTEFAVQGIVRDVDDFLVIRGRLTGMAEVGGGFYFIPWDAIEYVGFMRPVKEDEVRAIFPSEERISPVGAPAAAPVMAAPRAPEPVAPPPAAIEPEVPPETAATPEPAPEPAPEEPPKPKSGERPIGAAKAALLERLRARRAALDPTKR